MAPPRRRKSLALDEQLFQTPERFEFFQAVRLLERISRERHATEPEHQRRPVGLPSPPDREAVRFRALVSMSFPAGPIAALERPQPPGPSEDWELPPPQMTVAFGGLAGPQGVLPQHYTAMLLERVRNKDFALRDFLDLFNHRWISLFYRAWEKYRFASGYERAVQRGQGDDLFTYVLYCLTGLGTANLRGRLDVADEAFIYYGGHFSRRQRPAVALEAMLEDYLGLTARVEQFFGQWLYLSPEEQSRLPTELEPLGLNCQLGVNVVVGERVWDVQSKFRVRLGPLDYAQFRRFVPTSDRLRPLCQLVRSFAGPEFDFDVQPVLRGPEVPWCQLGGDGADAALLGWNTWIRGKPFDRDVSDAVFSLSAI